jgi:hypothetical protein
MGDRDVLLREIRPLARERGLDVIVDVRAGKGSHYVVRVGRKRTIVPYSFGTGTRYAILRQLGLR